MENGKLRLNFNSGADSETHTCDSFRDGDWIIYRCKDCPDYERRVNWRTKEMKVKFSKSTFLHTGFYSPKVYLDAFRNVN